MTSTLVDAPGTASRGSERPVTVPMHHYADAVRLLERESERELDVLRDGLGQVRDRLGVGIAVAGELGLD